MGDNYSAIYAFILYSVLLGFCFGILYDFFRMIRMVFCLPGIIRAEERSQRPKNRLTVNIIVFICDILFFVISACITAVFVFHANNGNIRGIALFGSLAGFVIYYNTLGRLVTLISKTLIRAVFYFFRFLSRRVVLPALRGLFKALCYIFKLMVYVDSYLYTRRIQKRLTACAKNGFLKL